MSDFELNKPQEYIVQNVEENDFINSNNSTADQAKYGLTYSVKFEGDAETFLWTTKTPPESGKTYFGHIQKTSGKMLRFKLDEREGTQSSSSSSKPPYQDQSKNITLGLVWKVLIGIQGVPENPEEFAKFYETVGAHVTELILMSEKLKSEE